MRTNCSIIQNQIQENQNDKFDSDVPRLSRTIRPFLSVKSDWRLFWRKPLSEEVKHNADQQLHCQICEFTVWNTWHVSSCSSSSSWLCRRWTGGTHQPGDLGGDPPLLPCHLDAARRPRRQVSSHLHGCGWTHPGGEIGLNTFLLTLSSHWGCHIILISVEIYTYSFGIKE